MHNLEHQDEATIDKLRRAEEQHRRIINAESGHAMLVVAPGRAQDVDGLAHASADLLLVLLN